MENELKQALLDLLSDIRAAKDFAVAEAPDVVQQMVMYDAVMGWSVLAASTLAYTAAMCITNSIDLRWSNHAADPAPRGALLAVVGSIGFVLYTLPLYHFFPTAISATFFPKWHIVQRIAEMVG